MSFRRPAAVLTATVVALATMTTVAMAAGQTTVTAPDAGTAAGDAVVALRPRASTVPSAPSSAAPTTDRPTTDRPTTTAAAASPTTTTPAGLTMASDSVPAAGWFHVTGVAVPSGTAIIRYANVGRATQVGLAEHGAGPLSFWFRAPGAPGTTITIRLEALDGFARPVADLGTITLSTGDALLPLPPNSGSGRRMVVHSDQQQVWLVEEDGHVSGTFLMSGRRLPTASGYDQPGVFRVYSRSRTMRYCEDGTCGYARDMVRYQRTRSSVGTHGLPIEHGAVVQGDEDLGWPLSHGCTRLSDATAHAVYGWATVGTVVIVF